MSDNIYTAQELEYLKKSTENGNTNAQYEIGYYYEYIDATEKI